MPEAISPEALPGWPYKETEEGTLPKAEEDTLVACLLGKHVARHQDKVSEQPLTGVFGHVMLLWEALRHDEKLVELLTKLRNPPDNDDWKNDPDFSTLFTDKIGFIVSAPIIQKSEEEYPEPFAPWFPDIPFLSVEAVWQKDLVERFRPGQPALEIAKVEILDDMGVFEKFKNLAALARSRRKPRERRSESAIMKREKGDPDKPVYDANITFRPYMGVEAVRKAIETLLTDNSELFPKVDTITRWQWEDPRPILQDLAILRLTKLYGYPDARKWTKEHRPKKCLMPLQPEEWESYFGERGDPKGNQPIFRDLQQYANAVRKALKVLEEISVQRRGPT
jgi:hypothetical protein